MEGSAYQAKYEELFGSKFLGSDALFAGAAFDSFFFPETVIRESEALAAEAFGAQDALFVTSGTSVSNQIALLALLRAGDRVLADRGCHQSIHFALHAAKAPTDYIDPSFECELTGRGWFSLDDLIERVMQAQGEGAPYSLVILNGQSYDGIIYRIPEIVEALLNRGARLVNLLIDEAWGAAGYFHETLSDFTAMSAAKRFASEKINIVATHSVHKSMSCLRQASMILCHGGRDLAERLRHARYKLHTTSPSYPILVSIDVARAQMVDEGAALTRRCDRLAEIFEQAIDTDKQLSLYSVNKTALPERVRTYAALDRTKVSVNVASLGRPPSAVKEALHQQHGIWVRRSTASSILFNLHIGISDCRIDQTLDALRRVQGKIGAERERTDAGSYPLSNHFVIPYPPGIPIVMPGDALTPAVELRISAARKAGAHVFTIS